MGQQQLLLIILGVIVVGIAVVVGISMFQDNAISANRDALINDLIYLGGRAQQQWIRPRALGGCQGDWNVCAQFNSPNFAPLTIKSLTNTTDLAKWTNPNGFYVVTNVQPRVVTIVGEGTQTFDNQLVKVTATVTDTSITTFVNN